MFLAKKILAALLLPPAGPLLLALFGLWLSRAKSRFWRYGGIGLAVAAIGGLLALSLPLVSDALQRSLERHPPISAAQLAQAQAIVVLGGGTYFQAPEYGGDTVNGATLKRIRYGAWLARASKLPVLVTGGAPWGGTPEASTMAKVLRDEYGVAARWVETESRDTEENALHSARMLREAGITRIALVSHAWHLPRAVPLFERAGLQVLPAPTAFATGGPSRLERLLPAGLDDSRSALHEYLGMLYNRLRN